MKRVLEPIERISEVLFGLIMVLTFTGSISAAESGRAEIRTMLYGALGCNLAWGLIDGIFYLMGRINDRGAQLRTVREVRAAPSAEQAQRRIAEALPPVVAAALQPAEYERIRRHLNEVELGSWPALQARDWSGALGVFLLVVLSTFPVVLPFVFLQDAMRALRLSNAIAIAMLFLTGYAFGRSAGWRPWLMGLAMVGLGMVLVGITIALGG